MNAGLISKFRAAPFALQVYVVFGFVFPMLPIAMGYWVPLKEIGGMHIAYLALLGLAELLWMYLILQPVKLIWLMGLLASVARFLNSLRELLGLPPGDASTVPFESGLNLIHGLVSTLALLLALRYAFPGAEGTP